MRLYPEKYGTCWTIAAKLQVSCWGLVTCPFAYSPRVHRAICKFSLRNESWETKGPLTWDFMDDTTEGSHIKKCENIQLTSEYNHY